MVEHKTSVSSLQTAETERNHLALLLDTVQFKKKEFEEKSESNVLSNSNSFSSESASSLESSKEEDKFKLSVHSISQNPTQPKVIELIKDNFLGIMKVYEDEKYYKDSQLNEITKLIKSSYAKNISYASDGAQSFRVSFLIIDLNNLAAFTDNRNLESHRLFQNLNGIGGG